MPPSWQKRLEELAKKNAPSSCQGEPAGAPTVQPDGSVTPNHGGAEEASAEIMPELGDPQPPVPVRPRRSGWQTLVADRPSPAASCDVSHSAAVKPQPESDIVPAAPKRRPAAAHASTDDGERIRLGTVLPEGDVVRGKPVYDNVWLGKTDTAWVMFDGYDADASRDAHSMPAGYLKSCLAVAEQKGFGGFAVFEGTAYFRKASGLGLKRRLEKVADCKFYAHEPLVSGAGREEVKLVVCADEMGEEFDALVRQAFIICDWTFGDDPISRRVLRKVSGGGWHITLVVNARSDTTLGYMVYKHSPKPDGLFFVWQLAIMDGHRTKGLGKMLIDWSIEEAKNLDVYELQLNSLPSSLGFYGALGFTVVPDHLSDGIYCPVQMKMSPRPPGKEVPGLEQVTEEELGMTLSRFKRLEELSVAFNEPFDYMDEFLERFESIADIRDDHMDHLADLNKVIEEFRVKPSKGLRIDARRGAAITFEQFLDLAASKEFEGLPGGHGKFGAKTIFKDADAEASDEN